MLLLIPFLEFPAQHVSDALQINGALGVARANTSVGVSPETLLTTTTERLVASIKSAHHSKDAVKSAVLHTRLF
jgi:hypothetical protein